MIANFDNPGHMICCLYFSAIMKHLSDSGGYLPPEELFTDGRTRRKGDFMRYVTRILPLVAGLLFVSGVTLAAVVGNYVPETLEVGPAASNGTVSFTLNAIGGAGSLPVSLPVSAGDSAAVVAAKVQAAVSAIGGSTWGALASGRTVTFSHFDGTTWDPVAYISGLVNTASGQDLLAADGSACGGYIALSFTANASGKTSNSGPGGSSTSSLTFWINGMVGPYTINLTAGQTAASIASQVASQLGYLGAQQIGGYVMGNMTTIQISLMTRHAAIAIQTNDSALQGNVLLSEANGGGDGGGGTDRGNGPPM